MKNILIILTFTVLSTYTFSQMSASAGPTLVRSFGLKTLRPGFHLGFEINDDDFLTLYGRFIYCPAVKGPEQITIISGKDFDVSPFNIEVKSYDKKSFGMLEFGKRYYFGDGYESGFGLYGGSTLALIFSTVKTEMDDFDETKYQYTASTETSGTILGLGLGANGGIKHSFPFGTIYFDAGINYTLLQIPSNIYAQNVMNDPDKHRSLNFIFNLGFRKDFY